jgi:hypothetical protein
MYIRAHIFGTIILTQLTAIFYTGVSTLPYFPIEISRTAASNPVSRVVLLVGLVTSGLHLLFSSKGYGSYIAWMGMCILSIFDDVEFWFIHMVGSTLAMIGGGIEIYYGNDTTPPHVKTGFLLCAVILYIVRLLLKFVAVLGMEMGHNLFSITLWVNVISDSQLRNSITHRALMIMYQGKQICQYEYSLVIFKVAGILQWVLFYMLIEGVFSY